MSTIIKYFGLINCVFISLVNLCYAQDDQLEKKDSIAASVISERKLYKDNSNKLVKVTDLELITTVTGENDIVKLIQTLPGISTGAEGGSAFYARGGNLGGNLICIDGIPLYGSSHLLGLSSAYSSDIVDDMLFQLGGFSSDVSNLTSSHIDIATRDGDMFNTRTRVSLSNYMLGACVSTPIIKKKLSFIGSVRISPLAAELRTIKGSISALDNISDIEARIYDVYGKLKWNIDRNQVLKLSIFHSLDSYGYRMGDNSDERMGWRNIIVSANHCLSLSNGRMLNSSLTYNNFVNYQGMRKSIDTISTSLSMLNPLEEIIAQSTCSGKNGWQYGAKLRYANFAPGSATYFSEGLSQNFGFKSDFNTKHSILTTIHAQKEFSFGHKFYLRGASKANSFTSWREAMPHNTKTYFNLEASLLAKANINKRLGVQASIDWTCQYYHTLEGIPAGWSIDLIVPSDSKTPPERALQFYAGSYYDVGLHHFSIGAYYKNMYNLIYFSDATKLFNSSVAGWENNIKIGTGLSYGAEFLYELNSERVDARLAYTLSKTDRLFKDVNKGRRFPAKFDRRHILNLTANAYLLNNQNNKIGLSTLFTYQSGHYVSLPAGEFTAELLPSGEEKIVEYFDAIHNWQVPAYIRWDLSVFWHYGQSGKCPGKLNVGIYNVLNRHNAYNISYDPSDKKWKKFSLFPIMPSISWSMEF